MSDSPNARERWGEGQTTGSADRPHDDTKKTAPAISGTRIKLPRQDGGSSRFIGQTIACHSAMRLGVTYPRQNQRTGYEDA